MFFWDFVGVYMYIFHIIRCNTHRVSCHTYKTGSKEICVHIHLYFRFRWYVYVYFPHFVYFFIPCCFHICTYIYVCHVSKFLCHWGFNPLYQIRNWYAFFMLKLTKFPPLFGGGSSFDHTSHVVKISFRTFIVNSPWTSSKTDSKLAESSRGDMGKIMQFRGWFSNTFLNVESPTAPIEGSRTSQQTRVRRCVETVRLILCWGDFVQQRFTCKCCWTNSDCFLFNTIFQQQLHMWPQERLNLYQNHSSLYQHLYWNYCWVKHTNLKHLHVETL